MFTVIQDPGEPNTIGGSLLDEIVRDGARQMLAAALQAEVAAYVDAHRGEVDAQGRRMVVRNGSQAARLPRSLRAVADDHPASLCVDLATVGVDIGRNLGLQRRRQHLPGPVPNNLIE